MDWKLLTWSVLFYCFLVELKKVLPKYKLSLFHEPIIKTVCKEYIHTTIPNMVLWCTDTFRPGRINVDTDFPNKLTRNSNFGVPGIWVFYLPRQWMSACDWNTFKFSKEWEDKFCCFFWLEPPLLPIGFNYRDTFSNQSRVYIQELRPDCNVEWMMCFSQR